MIHRWASFTGAALFLGATFAAANQAQKATCPVKRVEFEVKANQPFVNVNGKPVYFC